MENMKHFAKKTNATTSDESEANMKHFEILNNINVNDKIEKKDKLAYLSWAWAWAETKKKYPDAKYGILKNENKMPYFYDDLTGYMVYTWVEIEEIRHEMWLPVMDGKNKAMFKAPYTYKTSYGNKSVERATVFDINKALMRCLTKNLAMFGVGLYIYNGEDLPEVEKKDHTNKLWKQIKIDNPKTKDITKDIINALYKKFEGNYSEALKALKIFNINSFDEIGKSNELDNLYNVLIKPQEPNKKEQVKKPEEKKEAKKEAKKEKKEIVKPETPETKKEESKKKETKKEKSKKPETKKEENLNAEDIEALEELAKSKISNYNHTELIDFVLINLKKQHQTSTNLNSIPKKYLPVMKNMIAMYKAKKEQATLKAKKNKEPENKNNNKNNSPLKDIPETKDF